MIFQNRAPMDFQQKSQKIDLSTSRSSLQSVPGDGTYPREMEIGIKNTPKNENLKKKNKNEI